MNNEIKQGDKVRVSKDAPKVYLSSVNNLFKYHVCKVDETDGDSAIIRYADIGIDLWLAIPTKYLIKVNAEAKEPKFKVGDKVVVHYSTGDRIGRIQEIMWDGTYDIDYGGGCTGHNITRSQIEPYTEPTEQTEAEKQAFALGERVVTPYGCGVIGKDIEGKVAVALESGGYCGIDNANKILTEKADTDWDAYTANLAKELAIAYGKRGKSPLDAVAVAKEITKRLKQK